MAAVTFKVYTGSKLVSSGPKDGLIPEYKDGQIIFAVNYKKICMDFNNYRTDYSPTATVESDGINYIGIAKTKPTGDTVELLDGTTKTAHEKDMIVFENKEYLYRYGTGDKADELGWYEVGNEDAYNWVIEEDQ